MVSKMSPSIYDMILILLQKWFFYNVELQKIEIFEYWWSNLKPCIKRDNFSNFKELQLYITMRESSSNFYIGTYNTNQGDFD